MRSNIERTASGARVTGTLRGQPTCSGVLLAALGCLEEGGQGSEVLRPLAGEGRHRAARIDARGALQVRDLEGDPLVLRSLVAEIGRTEIVTPDAKVGMAVETADDREELRPLHGHGIVGESLLLRPRRHMREVLHPERLLRS